MTITGRTNCSDWYDGTEFAPRCPCQFGRITFVQQHFKRMMRVDDGVHRNDAHDAWITFDCMARDNNTFDCRTAHIDWIFLLFRVVFGRFNGKLQLLCVTGKTLPNQCVRCHQLSNFVVSHRTFCGRLNGYNAALHNYHTYRYWYPHFGFWKISLESRLSEVLLSKRECACVCARVYLVVCVTFTVTFTLPDAAGFLIQQIPFGHFNQICETK